MRLFSLGAGVWDIDQKFALLMSVYGRTKRDHLTRDEFALVLKRRAKVYNAKRVTPNFTDEADKAAYERAVGEFNYSSFHHVTY